MPAPPSRRGGGSADASRSAVGHPPTGWARSPSHSSAILLESSFLSFDRARPLVPSASARAGQDAAIQTGLLKPGFECRRRGVGGSIVCRRDDADADPQHVHPPVDRARHQVLVAGEDGGWHKSTARAICDAPARTRDVYSIVGGRRARHSCSESSASISQCKKRRLRQWAPRTAEARRPTACGASP